jgi:hypothetical protein
LAKELAVLWAIKHQVSTSPDTLKFHVIESLYALLHLKALAGEPVVVNDVEVGKTMYREASVVEFLLAAVNVEVVGAMRLLKTTVSFNIAPRLYTTNRTDFASFIETRDDSDKLSFAHVEAVRRRCVWLSLKAGVKLYSDEQRAAKIAKNRHVSDSTVTEMDALLSKRMW